MMESRKAVDALETYLADGVTWTCLAAIATSTVAQGGLALVRYQSTLYKFVFGKSPPHIIDDRPETNVAFLEWLIPRERHILPCVEKGIEQRDCGNNRTYQLGLSTLRDRSHVLRRTIEVVMLKKSLYLYYKIKADGYIANHTTFDELVVLVSAKHRLSKIEKN